MRYWKAVIDGTILAIGVGAGFDAIEQSEYEQIKSEIENKPICTEDQAYRLREDLTWEAYEVEPPGEDPEEEVTAEEIAAAIEEAMA